MSQARLVVLRSLNGRDNWEPIGEYDVPEFVKDPVTMGRLMAGDQCMDAGEGTRGSAWYKAMRVVSEQERAMVDAALRTIN